MSKSIMTNGFIRSLCSPLVACLIGMFVIQVVYYFRQPMRIVTVNITGMASSFVKETAKQNLTMEQKQQKVNQFGQSIQRVMTDMAKRKNLVIMPSEAVIAGSTDFTQEVMTEIKKEMSS